jgi:hypothetical protein
VVVTTLLSDSGEKHVATTKACPSETEPPDDYRICAPIETVAVHLHD